jgi:hypothetical protein
MLILSFDIATTTGYCWFEPPARDDAVNLRAAFASMRPGSFKVTGEEPEDKAADMAPHLIKMFRQGKPDLLVIEQPKRHVQQHEKVVSDLYGRRNVKTINPATTILLNQLTGAVVTVARAYDIPFVTIPEDTWRREAYGFGRKRGWQRKDWKKHARELCQLKGIHVTNDDQAEACWIAYAFWRSQAFKMLQRQRAA